MGTRHHPMDNMVKEAVGRVVAEGTENADFQDVLLTGFEWIGDKMTQEPNLFTKFKGREASGVGGGAAILYILQLLGIIPAGG